MFFCTVRLDLSVLEMDLATKRIGFQRIFHDPLPISTPREARAVFLRLTRLLTPGDKLYVPSLGSLGPTLRDALHSIWKLKNQQIALYCIQLGPVDLTSSEARETIAILSCALEICGES